MQYFYKKHTLLFSLLLSSFIIAMEQTPEQLLRLIQQTPDISYIDTSLLLEKNKGENVFHLACRQGDTNSLKKMFCRRSKNDIEKLLFERGRYANLGIHRAAEYGHDTVVATLLGIHIKNEGYISDLTLHHGFSGHTPLHFAAIKGHIQVVKVLLQASSLIYKTLKKHLFSINSFGLTALQCAALNGDAEITEFLLKADPASAVELVCMYDRLGNTPIHGAINEGYAHVLNVFIQTLGYNIFYLKNRYNTSVADYVIKKNRANINALLDSLNLECSLCLDRKNPTEFYTLSNCNRQSGCKISFCKGCLLELITTHLDEGSTRDLKCPNFNCTKKINPSDIYNITQDRKDLYNRFLEISFEEFKIDNQQGRIS